MPLQFAAFNADQAWAGWGGRLRELAQEAPKPVAIGIWLAGQTLLYTGTNGISAGNEDWLRRKRNTVMRFGKSSLLVGSELARSGSTLEAKTGADARGTMQPTEADSRCCSRETGCVGAIVISGLTQREDHALVVVALGEMLGVAVPQLP